MKLDTKTIQKLDTKSRIYRSANRYINEVKFKRKQKFKRKLNEYKWRIKTFAKNEIHIAITILEKNTFII